MCHTLSYHSVPHCGSRPPASALQQSTHEAGTTCSACQQGFWKLYVEIDITSLLNHSTLNEVSVMAGSAVSAAELTNLPSMMKMQPFGLGLHPLNSGDIWLLG